LSGGAIGMVSTHDLPAAEIVDRPGARARTHFEDQLSDGQVTPDYRLRPVVPRNGRAAAAIGIRGLRVLDSAQSKWTFMPTSYINWGRWLVSEGSHYDHRAALALSFSPSPPSPTIRLNGSRSSTARISMAGWQDYGYQYGGASRTFRVDGLLKALRQVRLVRQKFGHLFYKDKFSHYVIASNASSASSKDGRAG
jgi:hypothetical protein